MVRISRNSHVEGMTVDKKQRMELVLHRTLRIDNDDRK